MVYHGLHLQVCEMVAYLLLTFIKELKAGSGYPLLTCLSDRKYYFVLLIRHG